MMAAVASGASSSSSSSSSKKDAKTITLNDGQYLADVELTSSCSPPTKLGGVGYCGPSYCGAFSLSAGRSPPYFPSSLI